MRLLYDIGINLYFLMIWLAARFNNKAKLWLKGRQKQTFIRYKNSIWFHFASLGEFEQGRPVLEQMRKLHPDNKLVITFFSPSGYEIRKNTPLADAVYYLPLDTFKNARNFIETIDPKMAVFTKYEYWYHFFNEMHRRNLPIYIVSGIFRRDQVFFKWYGGLHRMMLSFVTYFFVQDDNSRMLLNNLGFQNVCVSGDTRFDRVFENARQPKTIELIKAFKNEHRVFIAGSTWPEDEKLIVALIAAYPEWKFIIAPHEIGQHRIDKLMTLLPSHSTIKYSQIGEENSVSDCQTLIIDNIGMLSSLYQYGDIAFIGGGFGAGIHNTLEAAAFGIPVIFGPNFSKFKEAIDLINLQAGFSVKNEFELKRIVDRLVTDLSFYQNACSKAKEYISDHTRATQSIVMNIVALQNK